MGRVLFPFPLNNRWMCKLNLLGYHLEKEKRRSQIFQIFCSSTCFQSWLNIRITWGAWRTLEIGPNSDTWLNQNPDTSPRAEMFWLPSRAENQYTTLSKRHGPLQKSHLNLWEGTLASVLTETVYFPQHYFCTSCSRTEFGLVNQNFITFPLSTLKILPVFFSEPSLSVDKAQVLNSSFKDILVWGRGGKMKSFSELFPHC